MALKCDCSDATAKGIRNNVTSEQKINVQNNLVVRQYLWKAFL
jgi:hypothetical protein